MEPCNPFLPSVSNDYATHKGYVDLLAYAARRAGVHPLVTFPTREKSPAIWKCCRASTARETCWSWLQITTGLKLRTT